MPRIWTQELGLDALTKIHANTAVAHVGIEFTEVGDDFLGGRVPVTPPTKQPNGVLHGGVSILLAETLGTNAALMTLEAGQGALVADISANYLRSVSEGWVNGVARPMHLGRATQVWLVDLTNDAGQLTCVSLVTLTIGALSEMSWYDH